MPSELRGGVVVPRRTSLHQESRFGAEDLGPLVLSASDQAVGHQPVHEYPDRPSPVADGIERPIVRVRSWNRPWHRLVPGVQTRQHALQSCRSDTRMHFSQAKVRPYVLVVEVTETPRPDPRR